VPWIDIDTDSCGMTSGKDVGASTGLVSRLLGTSGKAEQRKLKEERIGELNAETQSAQRSKTAADGRVVCEPNMRHYSTIVTDCQ
jgi:hypothetical protein